ncbi:MAG: ferrous iron transport protein B [Lachnospiraceae bacterium]|nr:ferrous iron transport protein B [Candidatus Minthocola equi]
MTLKDLELGQSAEILSVGGEGALRQHFLDMGLIPGAAVTLEKYAPMGDPMELRVHDYELSLRLEEAEHIGIKPGTDTGKIESTRAKKAVHPGLGESGKYHDRTSKPAFSKGEIMTFALVGNQNCGKTTLFNQLTGSNQHVGNFPGVTVDRKDGQIRGIEDTLVTDLPGIYSLSPFSNEEIVSRDFIINTKPACIINIADATNIERNLYLTMQLMELGIPMVLALNMMDEVRENGGSVDINELEHALGIPVVAISAVKNEGVDELIRHAVHIARYQEKPVEHDFCEKNANGGAMHRCLHTVMATIEDHAEAAGIPLRFAATKVVEGDKLVIDALHLDENERELIEHTIRQLEEESGLDGQAAIARMRFRFINKVCAASVIKPHDSKQHLRSKKIDEILTGKYTAIPAFILIMALVFYLTFNVIGAFFQGLLEHGIDALAGIVSSALIAGGAADWLHSLVINGIFAGVGSVISFLPIIVTLFLFLSLLEDSGYMARIAFVMDKLLRKIGLSGRSIVPLLIGFGCTVPAVMASRTLPSARDRKMTILLTPFMSCTAKLPIYGFFVAAFFPKSSGLIMVGLYLLSITIGILVALVAKKTAFKGEAVPFVMELPNYRMPGLKNVLHLLWDKAKDFIERAFSVIFIASIVIWLLTSFDLRLNLVADSSLSILALLAGLIAPVFSAWGCGSWKIVTSLITGFMAKESVVSGLMVLYGGQEALSAELSVPSAAALLVFCLLYTPCVAAINAIRRELGGWWAAFVVIFQCVLAWLAAYATFFIVGLF